jgi:hypothetical protein
VKKKEELPMNLDRGAWQIPLDSAREEQWALHANLFRPEPTDPALNDQPALDVSPEDALMEQIKLPASNQNVALGAGCVVTNRSFNCRNICSSVNGFFLARIVSL